MHELAVTQSILDIVLRHTQGRRVVQINLVIGQFSSIVDESIQFYWQIIAQDTLAEHARLHFERIPGSMTCSVCATVFQPSTEGFACAACGSAAVYVSGGREFHVDSIDVE